MLESKIKLMDFWKAHLRMGERELAAFSKIRREDFVEEELKAQAYQDTALPILRGKTISQPTTVMMMTAALELEEGMKVLEVGSGSGYQAAIIAVIVGTKGKVITTEVVPELVVFARENLKKAGIRNVTVLEEDGSKGYLEEAPYDRIIMTAAAREFPKELLEQLKPDGIIVGPIGNAQEQEMVKGTKGKDGKLQLDFLGQFLFSPLYGKYGFED